jgi:hypothetical protein
LFVWLIWRGEIRFQAFRQVGTHPTYLLLVVLSQGILFLLVALRWRILARSLAMAVPYGRILNIFLMGEFFSLFFLGAMGGDLSRMILLGSNQPQNKSSAVLTVLLDKAVALWVLCAIGLTAMLVSQPQESRSLWTGSMKLVLSAPLLGVPTVLVLSRLMPALLGSLIGSFMSLQQLSDFSVSLAQVPAMIYLKIGLLNLLTQALVIFNFVSCALSLGVFHIPFLTYCVVVPLGFIALAMPFSIGGLGVGQLAFGELFKLYGVTDEALGGNLSTLHIAVWGLFALLGGALFGLAKSEPSQPVL